MKKIKLLMFTMLVAFAAFSQTSNNKKRPSLGVNFMLKDFKTPSLIKASSLSTVLNNKQWSKISQMSPGLTLSYLEGLSNNIDFMARLSGSFVNYPFKANTVTSSGQDKLLVELDANVNLKLLPDNYFLVPYFSAGVGASMFAGQNFAAFFPIGAGLQLNLGEETFLHIQFTHNVSVTELGTENFNYRFGLSSPINDRPIVKPIAPPPPPPPPPPPVVEVDTDKDGIVDSKDKCPTVPGVAKYNGCPIPDTDKDGINDDEDKCPNVAGVAKYNGCPIPDGDGDGVNDDEDKCPTVAGVARFQGCPIPDADGDGVNDEEDKCPTLKGTKSSNGCPELAQYNFKSQMIQFNTGSSDFTNPAIVEMTKLVKVLKDHPELTKISIEGHTDDIGKDEMNMKLSEVRCAAVKKFLTNKGISADRLSTTAFGETKPVVDNSTEKNRAQNRRVEFKVGG